MKKLNLSSQVFGRLTVLYLDGSKYKGKGLRHWVCDCECGYRCSVLQHHLTSGNTKSCGCLRKEKTAERNVSRRGQKKLSQKSGLSYSRDYSRPIGTKGKPRISRND